MARPMPREAPVTRTVRLVEEVIVMQSLFERILEGREGGKP